MVMIADHDIDITLINTATPKKMIQPKFQHKWGEAIGRGELMMKNNHS